VLDASAAIALLLDEPGAAEVDALMRRHPSRMSTVNAAEVIDVLIRRHGGDPDRVVDRVHELVSAVVEPAPASLEHATRAGELRARHFRRSGRLSLADCFCLATADAGESIVTTDGPLAGAARDEGIEVVVVAG
jgi:uncharacterized protein with PIN domain